MKYGYDKLRGRIVEKYGSQNRFAAVLKVNNINVSNRMTGKTGFSQEDIEEWSRLLEIDPDDYGKYFFT